MFKDIIYIHICIYIKPWKTETLIISYILLNNDDTEIIAKIFITDSLNTLLKNS